MRRPRGGQVVVERGGRDAETPRNVHHPDVRIGKHRHRDANIVIIKLGLRDYGITVTVHLTCRSR